MPMSPLSLISGKYFQKNMTEKKHIQNVHFVVFVVLLLLYDVLLLLLYDVVLLLYDVIIIVIV